MFIVDLIMAVTRGRKRLRDFLQSEEIDNESGEGTSNGMFVPHIFHTNRRINFLCIFK